MIIHIRKDNRVSILKSLVFITIYGFIIKVLRLVLILAKIDEKFNHAIF
tara:strand:+ start:80 stop:226 length:147 start_codon:yes stop_codon:yes gene_type:complete